MRLKLGFESNSNGWWVAEAENIFVVLFWVRWKHAMELIWWFLVQQDNWVLIALQLEWIKDRDKPVVLV